jgi:hypothetical protein
MGDSTNKKAAYDWHVSRIMECAVRLGLAGWATTELENLVDEGLDQIEINDDLFLKVILCHRHHLDDEEALAEYYSPDNYSFSYLMPSVFSADADALSARGLTIEHLHTMFIDFMEDHRTDVTTSRAQNSPWYDDQNRIVARSDWSELATNKLSLKAEDVYVEMTDTSATYWFDCDLRSPSDALWRLRFFLDTRFIRDGYQPEGAFYHYREYEVEEDERSLWTESISLHLRLGNGQEGDGGILSGVSRVCHLEEDEPQ